MASIDGPAGRVGIRDANLIATAAPYGVGPLWIDLRRPNGQSDPAAAPRLQRLVIEALDATVYAIRAICP